VRTSKDGCTGYRPYNSRETKEKQTTETLEVSVVCFFSAIRVSGGEGLLFQICHIMVVHEKYIIDIS